jgi:hypothetical protein
VSKEWIVSEMQCSIRINAIVEYTRIKVLSGNRGGSFR